MSEGSRATAIARSVAGTAGHAARVFITTHLAIDVAFGALLALVCYWIAADGSLLRGTLAAGPALLLAVVVGFILATQVTVSSTVARVIQQTALGRTTLDALVSAAGIEQELERDITIPQLSKLLAAAPTAPQGADDQRGSISRFARWIASRVWRVAMWATCRQFYATAQRLAAPDGTVKLARVKEVLAETIDTRIVEMVRARTLQWTALLLVGCAIIACAAAAGIRLLPIP